MIRVMIVDDEPHAREELEALLEEIGGCEIVASCSNGIDALKAINRIHPEALFLDVQMPVLNGFELLSLIEDKVMPHIVFVTAYDEYALKAFEEKTLDYLLKPVDKDRLKKTLRKMRSTLRSGAHPELTALTIERIPCLRKNRIKLVDLADVEFVRSSASGVNLVTPGGTFFTELTLKLLEDRTRLLRCHRQYLVNIAQIDEINLQEGGGAEIRTRSANTLPVSRRYLKKLKETLLL